MALFPAQESEQMAIPAAREVFRQVFAKIIAPFPCKAWAGTSQFSSSNR